MRAPLVAECDQTIDWTFGSSTSVIASFKLLRVGLWVLTNTSPNLRPNQTLPLKEYRNLKLEYYNSMILKM